jgi:hypothetical protein
VDTKPQNCLWEKSLLYLPKHLIFFFCVCVLVQVFIFSGYVFDWLYCVWNVNRLVAYLFVVLSFIIIVPVFFFFFFFFFYFFVSGNHPFSSGNGNLDVNAVKSGKYLPIIDKKYNTSLVEIIKRLLNLVCYISFEFYFFYSIYLFLDFFTLPLSYDYERILLKD